MDQAYKNLLQGLPKHLRSFVVDQNYARYTERDQAVWRFIMRRNLKYFKEHAHKSYLKGLQKTGITTDHIPDIGEMNRSLAKIGWGAVAVDGFLPPAIFMEFQFHKVLVISTEMRSIEHILYTPAPDIVHEAAGHAPIIADSAYAKFLQKFGAYGMKAFASKLDHEIYESIRHLSIIKEYPGTTLEEITQAEKDIKEKTERNTKPSEMTLLSRLHWWTVEYGLIGTPDDFKIYGAGLLSSVGESKHCESDAVKKIPLSMDALNYNYDITNEQPQLFITRSWEQLLSILDDYADTMAFRLGGSVGLDRALASGTIATCVYSSGMQVTGIVADYQFDAGGHLAYLQMKGPCSLSYDNTQLEAHGPEYHTDGFGSPIGKLKNHAKPLELLNAKELSLAGLSKGKYVDMEFGSGVRVKGILQGMIRQGHKLLLCSFTDCTVTSADGNILFNPAWGLYDMAVGENIPSVFAGPADKSKQIDALSKSPQKAIPLTYAPRQMELFGLYKEIHGFSHPTPKDTARLQAIYKIIMDKFSAEWLVLLNLLETFYKLPGMEDDKKRLEKHLIELKSKSGDFDQLISNGLKMLENINKPFK